MEQLNSAPMAIMLLVVIALVVGIGASVLEGASTTMQSSSDYRTQTQGITLTGGAGLLSAPSCSGIQSIR